MPHLRRSVSAEAFHRSLLFIIMQAESASGEVMSERENVFKGMEQEMLHKHAKAAARAYAFSSTHPSALIGRYPVTSIIAIIVMAALVITSIESGRSDREAANDAWYRAKLDCRLSGGNYEYFGTQGYHCIGGKRRAKEKS